MENHSEANGSCAVRSSGRSERFFVPRCDIYEREGALVVLTDMPGVGEKDVDLNLEKNVLTIDGRVKTEQGNAKALRTEYSEGSYRRVLHLSEEIDSEKIEASLKDGVLRILLPKSDQARKKARKVQVKSA